jgi:nitrate reductase gamma subunit
MNKAQYNSLDEKLGFWLFAVTHTQFILGMVLYFISPVVVFSGESMKEATARYWLVEHGIMMIIAITLITLGRITTKKIADSTAKYRKLFIYNGLALLLIIAAIMQSGRGFFNLPSY